MNVASFSMISLILIALLVVVVIAVPAAIVIAILYSSRSQPDMSSNPNLAPCPDCQKLVSIQAPTCPHCGRPLKAG